ncbi:MAG: (2Fe-2S) ferredoxin domain-containing protein [Ignavibacteriaceae bacterium]|nr:(2Fe-2S) ferredoxin domain-containing protein [Ignavibacteriaceae bacterium]
MKRFDKHIFICENKRESEHPRGCCHSKGGSKIKEKFKSKLKQLGLSDKVRANTSGCLDACEYGPVVLIYPRQTWYTIDSDDCIDKIIDNDILNDNVVEECTIKDKRFLKDKIE